MPTVGTQRNSFNDRSGLVTVAVFSHRGSPPQQHWTDETVLVADADMVAIGGGGTAARLPHGALLTASHPNEDLSGWVVSSKDHALANAHVLETYVIGMKIDGVSRQDLLDAVIVQPSDSSVAPHPESEAGIPGNDYVLVGGGFRVDWEGYGSLATASFPATEYSWKSRAKDHSVSDPASIRSYAIGIRKDLAEIGHVVNAITRSDGGQSHHPQAIASVEPDFALTGGGAEVHWDGYGSMLWNLAPSTSQDPSFSAGAKDHLHPDPSTITAFAIGIQIA